MKVQSPIRLSHADGIRDARDAQLLRLLQADARSSVSALARRMGMSAPAVRERIARLEDAGVIRGYSLDVDAAALGWPIQAYVRIRPMPGKLPKLAELAAAMPQVAECHRITGEDCLILRIYVRSLTTLDEVLDRFLPFGQTTTSLVQSTIVPPRTPPLPGTA
jgi:Lrp/AsnC family leucine-responsive transcriptional regulator